MPSTSPRDHTPLCENRKTRETSDFDGCWRILSWPGARTRTTKSHQKPALVTVGWAGVSTLAPRRRRRPGLTRLPSRALVLATAVLACTREPDLDEVFPPPR